MQIWLHSIGLVVLRTSMHLWFLIGSLFLPRIALFIYWLAGHRFPFGHPWDVVCWLFVPRLMTIDMVYRWGGFEGWFWLQIIAAVIAYWSGGKKVSGLKRWR